MKRLLAIALLFVLALAPASANIPGFANNILFGNNGSLTPPIGLWLMSNYSASPSPNIPNSMSSVPVSQNLLRAPRRLFSNPSWWGVASGSMTITDNNATAPDGTDQASTLTSTGAWSIYYAGGLGNGIAPVSLPAGTYTMACNAQAIGSSQTVNFFVTGYGGTQTSSGKSITTTWSRPNFTFTTTGTTGTEIGVKGSSALDANIVDCGLYAGSSDPGEEPLAGHMYLGGDAWDLVPASASSGHARDFGLGYATEQMPSYMTLSTVTTMAVIDCYATPSNGNYNTALYIQDARSQANFSAWTHYYAGEDDTLGIGMMPNLFIAGTSINTSPSAGMWNVCGSGAGYHVITHRYDANGYESVWLDDMPVATSLGFTGTNVAPTGVTSTAAGAGPITIGDLINGFIGQSGIGGHYYIAAMAVWNRALANSEIYAQIDSFTASLGVIITPWPGYVLTVGDSLASGVGDSPFPYPGILTQKAAQYNWKAAQVGFNYGVSGSGILLEQYYATYLNGLLPPSSRRSGRTFIIDSDSGSNDFTGTIPGGSVPAYAALTSTLCSSYASAGFNKVYRNTIIDRIGLGGGGPSSAWAIAANAFNADLISGLSGCAAVNSSESAYIGYPGSGVAANAMVYSSADQVHLIAPGYAIYDTYLENALENATIGIGVNFNGKIGTRLYDYNSGSLATAALAGGM